MRLCDLCETRTHAHTHSDMAPFTRGDKKHGQAATAQAAFGVMMSVARNLVALAKAAVENDEQEARCREGIMGLEEGDETDDACSQAAFLCFRRFLKDNGSSAFYDSGEIDGMAKFRAVQVRSSAREPSCPR